MTRYWWQWFVRRRFTMMFVGALLLATYLALLTAFWRLWELCATSSLKVLADDAEWHLMTMVGLCGALGAFVHAATSFTTYVGQGRLQSRWTWWYVLRMPIGMALALLLYFAFRAGLLSGNKAGEINVFGAAALGGMAGLFSKQAVDKLNEVFNTVFQNLADQQRGDKLGSAGEITGIEPSRTAVGTTGLKLQIRGSGFDKNAVCLLAGRTLPTLRQSAELLEVNVPLEMTAAPGRLSVAVQSPGAEPRPASADIALLIEPSATASPATPPPPTQPVAPQPTQPIPPPPAAPAAATPRARSKTKRSRPGP